MTILLQNDFKQIAADIKLSHSVFFKFYLYYDEQMHHYCTNYHTPTCFDTIVSSTVGLVINALPSYTSISNAAFGNTIYN